jgi:hypothetical protein
MDAMLNKDNLKKAADAAVDKAPVEDPMKDKAKEMAHAVSKVHLYFSKIQSIGTHHILTYTHTCTYNRRSTRWTSRR